MAESTEIQSVSNMACSLAKSRDHSADKLASLRPVDLVTKSWAKNQFQVVSLQEINCVWTGAEIQMIPSSRTSSSHSEHNTDERTKAANRIFIHDELENSFDDPRSFQRPLKHIICKKDLVHTSFTDKTSFEDFNG